MSNKDIDDKIFLDSVKLLKDRGFNHIHLLGGEPLINKNLLMYLKHLKNNEFSVSLNTNATLITDDFIEDYLPLVDQLSFSLDGFNSQINDKIRNKGTFDSVIKNIKKIKSSTTILLMNYVITNQNFLDLYKLSGIAEDLNIDAINIIWFYEVDNNKSLSPELQQLDSIFDELEKLLVVSSNKNFIINLDLPPKILTYFKEIGIIKEPVNKNTCNCFGYDTNVYMNYHGEIYPCHPFHEKTNYTYKLLEGNYLEYSTQIKEIMHTLDKVDDECSSCNFFSECLICPLENKTSYICKYIDLRSRRILSFDYNKLTLDDEYMFLFNRIINRNAMTFIEVTDVIKQLLNNNQINLALSEKDKMQIYGLLKKGVLHERLS